MKLNLNKVLLAMSVCGVSMNSAFADEEDALLQQELEQQIEQAFDTQGSVVPMARLQYNISNVQLRSGGLPEETIGWLDARLGVQGYQPVNEHMTVYGIADYEVTSQAALVGLDSKSNTLSPRFAFAGIDFNQFGRVSIGRVLGGASEVGAMVDYFAFNGGGETVASRASVLDSSAVGVERQDNVLQFENDVNGYSVSAGYIMNSGVFSDTGVEKGYQFKLGKTFEINESSYIKPVLSTSRTYASDRNPVVGLNHYQYWGAGVEAYSGDYGIALVYSEDTLDSDLTEYGKNRGFEGMLRWTGIDKLDLRAGYVWQDNSEYGNTLINDFIFDAHYFFTDNVRVIAEYSIRNADEFAMGGSTDYQYVGTEGKTQQDFFYLAFRYNF